MPHKQAILHQSTPALSIAAARTCGRISVKKNRLSSHTDMCAQKGSGFAVNSCAKVHSLQRRVRVFISEDEVLRLVHTHHAT